MLEDSQVLFVTFQAWNTLIAYGNSSVRPYYRSHEEDDAFGDNGRSEDHKESYHVSYDLQEFEYYIDPFGAQSVVLLVGRRHHKDVPSFGLFANASKGANRAQNV